MSEAISNGLDVLPYPFSDVTVIKGAVPFQLEVQPGTMHVPQSSQGLVLDVSEPVWHKGAGRHVTFGRNIEDRSCKQTAGLSRGREL